MLGLRGVSLVVSNVLIVLLVIVGVAVIWSVVSPTIKNSAEQIETDCISLQIKPVSCVYYPDSPANNPSTALPGVVKLNVKRDTGFGDLFSVKLLFTGDAYTPGTLSLYDPMLNILYPEIRQTGVDSIIERDAQTLKELETKSYAEDLFGEINSYYFNNVNFPPAGIVFLPKKVAVHAVVKEGQKICENSVEIPCTCEIFDSSVLTPQVIQFYNTYCNTLYPNS